VTGRIERGKVKVARKWKSWASVNTAKTVVTGWKCSRAIDEGLAGTMPGSLRGIAKEDVERGMVLAKGGSITPHTKFKAEVYILTRKKAGGTRPSSRATGRSFYLRTTDVTGVAEMPAATEMVMPGTTCNW